MLSFRSALSLPPSPAPSPSPLRSPACPPGEVRCPLGECRTSSAQCGTPPTCPPALPVLCPDLSCRARGADCPLLPEFIGQARCPDGSIVHNRTLCGAPVVCPPNTPVRSAWCPSLQGWSASCQQERWTRKHTEAGTQLRDGRRVAGDGANEVTGYFHADSSPMGLPQQIELLRAARI